MALCPHCQRPVAASRPRCIYCGGALPPDLLPPAEEPSAEAPAAASDRVVLVLRAEVAHVERMARALGWTAFEAAQHARRGGFHLLRRAPREEGGLEAERLRKEGLEVWAIPEDEVRAGGRPLVARGGRRSEHGLRFVTEDREVDVASSHVLLVVRGPITREYQPEVVRRRSRPTLAPGYRVHLWQREEPRPLELDPDAFDFGGVENAGSSQLQILEWVESIRGSAPLDDEFRRMAPVLSPSEEGEGGPVALLRGTRAPRPRGEELVVLDSVPQFRFFSGWRAAAERRRASPR